MNTQPVVQGAGLRYRERTQTRKEQLRAVKEKGILAVETPERIETRRGLIAAEIDLGDEKVLERVLGSNDLLPINYLEKGVDVGRSICRVRVKDAHQSWTGTGWMVSPSLLITNNHVLRSPAEARIGTAQFNYQEDLHLNIGPTHTYALRPDEFFFTSVELDFTLVAVNHAQVSGNSVPLSHYGHLQLIAQSGKALLQEPLSIIQHPGGDLKHIALRDNQLIDIFGHYAHYLTDTKKGSSGSPVFNNAWQVVALHHAGVPKMNKRGRWLTDSGHVWKPEMGEDKVNWIANEGIRISSIFAHLKAKDDWSDAEKGLLEEMGVAIA